MHQQKSIHLKALDSLTILYAEDEVAIRQNGVEYLSRYFKEVYEANDGAEALKVWKEKRPDIIMTDIKMPKLNGLEFAAKVRLYDKKVPIIIITAFTDKDDLLKAVELQLVKYLVKPVTSHKMQEALFLASESLLADRTNIVLLDEESLYDLFNKTLIIAGEVIKLTRNELYFFDYLVKNRQRAVTYREFENLLWQYEGMNKDALRTLIYGLRKKIALTKPDRNFIENISGIGYKLKVY